VKIQKLGVFWTMVTVKVNMARYIHPEAQVMVVDLVSINIVIILLLFSTLIRSFSVILELFFFKKCNSATGLQKVVKEIIL